METQFGDLMTGEIESKTMAFLMKSDTEMMSGKYALVPIKEYDKLIKIVREEEN
jgi:hypothetical protein